MTEKLKDFARARPKADATRPNSHEKPPGPENPPCGPVRRDARYI